MAIKENTAGLENKTTAYPGLEVSCYHIIIYIITIIGRNLKKKKMVESLKQQSLTKGEKMQSLKKIQKSERFKKLQEIQKIFRQYRVGGMII